MTLLGIAAGGVALIVGGVALGLGTVAAVEQSGGAAAGSAGAAALTGGMGAGLVMACCGLFVLWVATGPIGVAWLARAKGRDGLIWALLACFAPLLVFLLILCAGEMRPQIVVVRERR